jgi:hypothetical protein
MMDRDEMLSVLRAFETTGLEYVLIGATAMGLHGIVRATEDLDLMIRATSENIERLRRALRSIYSEDANIDEIRTDDLLGDYPAVRYYPPSGDLYFDILTRLGEATNYESIESQALVVSDVPIRVATPAALYRLKRGTGRALDPSLTRESNRSQNCGHGKPKGDVETERGAAAAGRAVQSDLSRADGSCVRNRR